MFNEYFKINVHNTISSNTLKLMIKFNKFNFGVSVKLTSVLQINRNNVRRTLYIEH